MIGNTFVEGSEHDSVVALHFQSQFVVMFADMDGFLRYWTNDFLVLAALFGSSYFWLSTKVDVIDVDRKGTVLKERVTVNKNVVAQAIRSVNSHFEPVIRREQGVARLGQHTRHLRGYGAG